MVGESEDTGLGIIAPNGGMKEAENGFLRLLMSDRQH